MAFYPTASDAAVLVVNLPADATLTIDGQKTESTGPRRVLVSPSLPQGKEFTYELKARIMKDGKSSEETKTVKVKAGQEIPVNFTAMAGSSGGEGARRLP